MSVTKTDDRKVQHFLQVFFHYVLGLCGKVFVVRELQGWRLWEGSGSFTHVW